MTKGTTGRNTVQTSPGPESGRGTDWFERIPLYARRGGAAHPHDGAERSEFEGRVVDEDVRHAPPEVLVLQNFAQPGAGDRTGQGFATSEATHLRTAEGGGGRVVVGCLAARRTDQESGAQRYLRTSSRASGGQPPTPQAGGVVRLLRLMVRPPVET
jgi:hypothetical protein